MQTQIRHTQTWHAEMGFASGKTQRRCPKHRDTYKHAGAGHPRTTESCECTHTHARTYLHIRILTHSYTWARASGNSLRRQDIQGDKINRRHHRTIGPSPHSGQEPPSTPRLPPLPKLPHPHHAPLRSPGWARLGHLPLLLDLLDLGPIPEDERNLREKPEREREVQPHTALEKDKSQPERKGRQDRRRREIIREPAHRQAPSRPHPGLGLRPPYRGPGFRAHKMPHYPARPRRGGPHLPVSSTAPALCSPPPKQQVLSQHSVKVAA